MPAGRFAPSPTGRLHLGNLRTAVAAWLFARADNGSLRLRFDDLDQGSVRDEHYETQAADLRALGLDWDGPAVRQSNRVDLYWHALDELRALDMLYPCFCSRREIREAAQAPNNPLAGHLYPGTCRNLSASERARRIDSGRAPAWRVRVEEPTVHFTDDLAGDVSTVIDDFVVARNDNTPAYHLVTVVDDDEMGIEQVVRADDLLDSTGRQLLIARLLGLRRTAHAHVPLVLGPDGQRLAKRHGSVTLPELVDAGWTPTDVLRFLAATLGLPGAADATGPGDLLAGFDPKDLPTEPLTLDGDPAGPARAPRPGGDGAGSV